MKKRIISLLLALNLCLGLLPAPVFAEEAPTNQPLAETPVSQNEEPQQPQQEPAPQNQEPQQPQEEPAPQGQENQQPQEEPAPQGQETPQPQPEPDPQGGETPQPPQGEPEQEEQPVRRALKANAPMAVAEGETGKEVTLTVGEQNGKLFGGVNGAATFPVTCENGNLNSLEITFSPENSNLAATVSEDGTTVTVATAGDAKAGTYQMTLTLGQTSQTVSVTVDAPFTIKNKEIQVASDQTSATLTLEVDVAPELEGQVQYTWMPDGKNSVVTNTNTVTLYPDNLKQDETSPGRYSAWVDCRVSCGTYFGTATRKFVKIIACDHSGAILYTKEGTCRGCGQLCPEDRPFITEKGEAIQIPWNADTLFVLDEWFPGTLYLWKNYTTARGLDVLTPHGDGTLELQNHYVYSELILDYFQNHSFTIQNGYLQQLLLGKAGSLILDNVTVEDLQAVPSEMKLELHNVTFKHRVCFHGTASMNGGTFEEGLWNEDENHTCLDLLAPGYAFAKEDGTVIDASEDVITGKVQVVSHTTCTYKEDKAGKCDCGRSCPHELLNEGYCTVCQTLVEPFVIGEQGYRSLEAAIEAAQAGQTIYLRGNYKLPSPVEISKNITLDLNSGCVLSGSFESSLLQITGANVTVQSGGIVNDQGPAVTVASGAKLTVKTVTFAGGSDHVLDVEQGGHADVHEGAFSHGVLYVNGSLDMEYGRDVKLVLGPNAEKISIVKGDFDSITLAGGKEYKDLLAEGSAYWADGKWVKLVEAQEKNRVIAECPHPDGLTDSQPCPYCDKTCAHGNMDQETGFCKGCGYQVYKAKVDDEMMSTFQKAMNAAKDGQTVTLLADDSLGGNLTLNKAITLNINRYTLKTSTFTVQAPLTICGGGEIGGEFSFNAPVTVQGTTLQAPKGVVEKGGSLCIDQDATVPLLSVRNGGSLKLKQGTIGKLIVANGDTVRLISGTITQMLAMEKGNILSILDQGKALKKDGKIVNGNESKVVGPVTVVDHTHTFNENNTCPCGLHCIHPSVTNGTCNSCHTAFAAEVDETTYYQDVGTALENAGQIVWLLRDAVLDRTVTVQENTTLRVDAFRLSGSGEIRIPGNVTLNSVQNGRIDVPLRLINNGMLTLQNAFSGTISSLTVEGGAKLESDGVFKGRVEELSISKDGGAELFSGSFGTIRCSDGQCTAKDLLPDGYAFYNTDTNAAVPCSTLISQNAPLQNVAVDACEHTAIDDHGNCAYCGMHCVAECVVSETTSYYGDLQSALDYIQGGRVKLLEDIKNGTFTVNGNGTLDLNGKTLHGSFTPTGSFTIQDSSQTSGRIESLVAGPGTKISGGSFGSIRVKDSATFQSILAPDCYYEQGGTPYDIPKDAATLQNVRVALCDHTSVREINGYGRPQYTCNCGKVTYLLTVTVGENDTKYFGNYNDGFDYAAETGGVVRFLKLEGTIEVNAQGMVTIDMENRSYSAYDRSLVIKSGSTVKLVGQGAQYDTPETGGGSGSVTRKYGEFIPVTVESGGTFVLPTNNLDNKPNMAKPSYLTVLSGGTATLDGGSTARTDVHGTLKISGGSHWYIHQYEKGQLNITGGEIQLLQIYGDLPQNTLSGGSYEKISVMESIPGVFKKFREVTFDDFQNMLVSGKAFQSQDDSSYLHEVEKDPDYGTSGTYSKELNKVNVTAAPFTGVQVVCQLGENEYPGSFTTVYGELEQDFCLMAQLENPSTQTQPVTYQWYQLQGETKNPLGTDAEHPLQKNLALGQYTYQVTASCKGFERTSEAFTVTVTKAPQTLAVEAQLQALPATAQPWEQTLEDTKIIPARKAYDSLTAVQKETVEQELLEKLETLEAGLKQWSVTQGNGQTWARGSGKNLSFTLGGQTRKLKGLAINGKLLEEKNYEVQDTLDAPFPLSLSAEYLQALQPGTYTLEARFGTESTPEVTFTVEIPNTYLDVTGGELAGNTTVTVNGVTYPVEELGDDSYVNLPENGDLLTAHNYQTGSENQTQDNYPTQMQVYRIIREETGARLERVYELDNLLQYAGCSIRLNGTKGIRMITSVDEKVKNALVNASLAGFTLEEYGTVVMRGVGIPTLETGSHNYAYKRGVNDPVFATVNGRCQYTNVLVGFTMEDCKQTLTLRPYIILKDQAGVLYTLYGGCVSRSIGYIAKQNENTYKPGTEGYRYVHEIIDAVYGQG